MWVLSLSVAAAAGAQEAPGDYSFFSADDRTRIRASAETDWGRPIVEAMRQAWEERQKHDMAVPERESGHFHHYFCPEHKSLLRFDWDEPARHWCDACGKHLTDERYDHAWVRFVHGHNQTFLRNSTWLYMATGDRTYLEPVRGLLLDYASKYPGYELHGHNMKPAPYGGKAFSQTLDEAVWMCDVAPAYAEVRPLLTEEEAARIETNLIRACADVIRGNRVGGNWQVWHNAGLACAAVALRDDALLDMAIEDPDYGYHHMMEVGVTKDGWWNERSPAYHFYPLEAMVHTAEAVRCRGIDLYDESLKRMFTGPLQAVYPDLTLPAHNDGWYGTSLDQAAPLYEVAALRFREPSFLDVAERCYAKRGRTHPRALLHGRPIEPDGSPLFLESCVLRDTGIAFLRNGTHTVVLKFGPHGGGHGHPDKLSLALHDGRRELVADMGTPGYGVPDYTAWYKRTISHSTVTGDGADQKPSAGELRAFEARPTGGTVSLVCDTAYPGVHMERRVVLDGARLEDTFLCSSEEPRRYEYILILTEPVAPPESARPASFSEGPGYDRISDAVEWSAEGPVTLSVGSATLTLSAQQSFSLITGTAPGIPGPASASRKDFKPCHPLIVRVEGPRMVVQATWELIPGGGS